MLDRGDARPRAALRGAARRRPGRRRAARRDRRRADLLGDRDPLRAAASDIARRDRPPARRARAAVRARRRARGVALGSTGTHPWADYREQRNIDTEHYRRVVEGLQYVARRNNTFSLHVHVGVHDADRAVRTCDRLRPVLPPLLAIGANSPFLDGRDTGLHSARTQIFTEVLPALRRPRRLRLLGGLPRLPRAARRARGSIVEYTQVWWSVRPHLAFGTVEVRICDAQATGRGVRGARRR